LITSPMDRFWARAQLECCLRLAHGGRSPDTTPRCWFFEIPRARHTLDHWKELVPRIMFDINTALRWREPTDLAWIDVERVAAHPFQPREVLSASPSDPRALGWVNIDRARVWEPAVCYYVDDEGRYDVMSAHDFSELLLYRLLGRGEITADEFVRFLDRYFADAEPSAGRRIYANAEERLRNLVTVRPESGRKTPNVRPFSCCPDVTSGDTSVGVPSDVRVVGEIEPGVAAAREFDEGGSASVYLEAVGPSLIQVVVVLRDFTGLGLVEVKRLAESAPAVVLSNVPRDEAERFVRELRRIGAAASLR
jgi:ribosomal protein L7/L12